MNALDQPDADRLAVIRECMESYDVGDDVAEWPNNIISARATVYADGTIARKGDHVGHILDEKELALCRSLAEDAERLMAGVSVGMGSEADDPFRAFFIVAPQAAAKIQAIDEALIRAGFRGTLFPPATLTVEPFADDTVWWAEVVADGENSDPGYFAPWRALRDWFERQVDFTATAFVRIGDSRELFDLPETSWPPGTVMVGSVLPRLALGLTRKGSLTGLFGYVVQT